MLLARGGTKTASIFRPRNRCRRSMWKLNSWPENGRCFFAAGVRGRDFGAGPGRFQATALWRWCNYLLDLDPPEKNEGPDQHG